MLTIRIVMNTAVNLFQVFWFCLQRVLAEKPEVFLFLPKTLASTARRPSYFQLMANPAERKSQIGNEVSSNSILARTIVSLGGRSFTIARNWNMIMHYYLAHSIYGVTQKKAGGNGSWLGF
jgi:hypothetical protein